MPDLVVFGSCESEMCGRAVAEAGGPHVVAVRAENGLSGATEIPRNLNRIESSEMTSLLSRGTMSARGKKSMH